MAEQSGRYYAMTALERDRYIVQLRNRGWTLKRIAKVVGMSESGVSRAVERICAGGFGEGVQRS